MSFPVIESTDMAESLVVRASTEERALSLLGAGLAPVTVAATLGVSESRISQLMSDENFASEVTSIRYQSLLKHNERDNKYDSLEDELLKKMEDLIPLMHRPMEVLRAMQVLNGAKRRGQATPDSIHSKQEVIQLVVPIQIINQFKSKSNQQNQVVSVGGQSLLTIQSCNLDSLAANHVSKKGVEYEHVTLQEREGGISESFGGEEITPTTREQEAGGIASTLD
jgi:hypothetical protein